jgi:hypothetical protein
MDSCHLWTAVTLSLSLWLLSAGAPAGFEPELTQLALITVTDNQHTTIEVL